jgi:uncharacterized protein YegL
MNRRIGLHSAAAICLWAIALVPPGFGQDAAAPATDDGDVVDQGSAVEQDSGVYQDNIVIVLDASGSMTENMQRAPGMTRMQAAKQALHKVVESVPESTNVGLLVFSGSNLQTDWVYPLSRVDRARLNQAIDLPEPAGATPLGAYLKKGADALLAQRQAQRGYGTYRLLMVTDGEATDQGLVDAYLPDVLSRGVTVDVIGVDMTADHALATRVNSYRRADDPESLVRAVSEVFAEVGAGQQDAAVNEEQFAIIQSIPDPLASAMLAALTSTGNHPIGEAPGQPAAAGGDSGGGPLGTTGVPTANNKDNSFRWLLIVVVIVIFIVRAVFRTRRPQRGRM